jgi:hypothetical protein
VVCRVKLVHGASRKHGDRFAERSHHNQTAHTTAYIGLDRLQRGIRTSGRKKHATPNMECRYEWSGSRNIANAPIERKFPHGGQPTARKLNLPTCCKDAESNRQVK